MILRWIDKSDGSFCLKPLEVESQSRLGGLKVILDTNLAITARSRIPRYSAFATAQWNERRGFARVVSAPAPSQFPDLGLQRLTCRLFFSQTVLRLP